MKRLFTVLTVMKLVTVIDGWCRNAQEILHIKTISQSGVSLEEKYISKRKTTKYGV